MANSVTHLLPYPIRKARYTLPLSFRVSAGTPTDPTTPDTEFSTDGGATFGDCAEEVTTGGSNGLGHITLSGAETDNPLLMIAAKSANCVTTPAILHPRNLPILASGTASAGAAGTITLASSITYDITGCFVRTTGGTGGGGTGGANNQARRITAYNTSTQVATVGTNWETTPDNTTTYDILCPEGITPQMLKAMNPATPGRAPVVDASGLIDANMVKVGPTGSGTAQTAKDLGALNVTNVNTLAGHDPGATLGTSTLTQTQVTGGAYALNSASFAFHANLDFTTAQKAATLARVTLTDTATNLTNDPTGVTTLLDRLTAARAGYMDNLNVGGPVASQADINALNQSASRRVILQTVAAFERPESSSTVYTVEARTFDGDGSATNADTTPTLTATGQTSGSLAANLSAATNPATGVYRWTYTVASNATTEPIRFDVSATMTTAFTLSCYTQVVDEVSTTWTSTDATHLTAIYNKLPSKTYLAGTSNSDGDIQLDEATGTAAVTAASVLAALGMATGNLDSQLATILALIDTEVAAIKNKTDNLPSDPADASDIAAAFSAVNSTLGTLATAAKLLKYVQLLARNDAAIATDNATELTAINANGGSGAGSFANASHSTQAIRVRGDLAWGSSGGLTAQQVRDAMQLAPTGVTAADSIDDKLDDLSIGAGSGAYAYTITVNDGASALQNARVRITDGGAINNFLVTNSSGQAPFGLDAGSYTLTITKDGYQFTPTTIVVTAAGGTTHSMTLRVVVPDPDPDKSVVAIYCYDEHTELEEGVEIHVTQRTAPSGDTGKAFDASTKTYTSDSGGLVTLTLWKNATYYIVRGDEEYGREFTPDEDTFAIDSFLGSP